MNTKVLVTGGGGQLARSIAYLSKQFEDIDFCFETKEGLDISNKPQLESYFENNKFDYCINCAAYTNVEQAEVHRDLAELINVDATRTLAELCKASSVTLIHISTDYIFDGTKKEPYLETDTPSPINHYGHTKNEGEKAIIDSLSTYFIIRTSWLYSVYGKNFVTTIANRVKDQADLTIVNTQIGSPTSCHELAQFIIFLIETDVNSYGIYNFTDKGETSWFEFAVAIASHFKTYDVSKISPVAEYKTKAKRPNYSVLSNAKRIEIYDRFRSWEDNVKWVVNQLHQP